VEGTGSGEALSALVSNRILDMAVSQARYALLLNEEGGILDDLFIYRLGAESWFVVVNASNREADYARLRALIRESIDVTDVSDETYMIAGQGPRAVELLDALSGNAVSPMQRFHRR
jgi:glycine cleavage system aminomethyltransferase T